MEYLKTNLNMGVLLLAGARSLFSLQKRTEICSLALASLLHYRKKQKKQKNYRNLLATLTYLLRQSLSLLCSLRSPLFFITEINGKNRKKQKFARWRSPSFSLQKRTEKTE